jgi:hypothetical protein
MKTKKLTTLKPPGTNKTAHTANTKFVMGDSYGTGIKNNVGKAVDITNYPKIKSKKPPKKLA